MDLLPNNIDTKHIKRFSILLTETCESKPQCDITSRLSEQLAWKSLQIPNAGKDTEKGNLSTLLMGL